MFDKIKSFITSNPAAITTFVIFLLCAGALTAAQGCNLASFVQVDVPTAVKMAVDIDDLKKPITLAEVDLLWADWNIFVSSNTARFEASIEDANSRYMVLRQMTDLGLGAAQQGLGGLPGGAILLSGLGALTGLFLKRPGEDARVAKEKQDSYNAGIALGAKAPDTKTT